MFLHIGNDKMVDNKEIVMILDYTKMNKTGAFKKYLIKFQKKIDQDAILNEKCKAVVITTEKIYLSPISSMTLMKRNLLFTK